MEQNAVGSFANAMTLLGDMLATAFVLTLVMVMVLAVLAAIEVVPTGRIRRRPIWRRPDSRADRFLKVNAALSEALAVIATISLLSWSLVDNATVGMTRFLKWTQIHGLAASAAWLVVFLYVFFGVTVIFGKIANDQAHPLIEQAAKRLRSAFPARSANRDEEAQVAYHYRVEQA